MASWRSSRRQRTQHPAPTVRRLYTQLWKREPPIGNSMHRIHRGEPSVDADAVLHFGEVVYGNVGASRRLDFTVIGRAVNEASRMEPLCAEVGRNLVISEAFARRCHTPFQDVGAFALRGIKGTRRIYAPA